MDEKMTACRMTLIWSRVIEGCWKRHEVTTAWAMVRVAVCGSARHTVANRTYSGKSAQSITNTHILSMKIWTNISMHQKNFLKDKNRPANLPQSANTVVKLTGLPDLLHTFKKQPVCKLRLWTSQDMLHMHTNTHLSSCIPYYSQVTKKKKKLRNNIFPTHTRGYIFKNRKPVKCNYMVK